MYLVGDWCSCIRLPALAVLGRLHRGACLALGPQPVLLSSVQPELSGWQLLLALEAHLHYRRPASSGPPDTISSTVFALTTLWQSHLRSHFIISSIIRMRLRK